MTEKTAPEKTIVTQKARWTTGETLPVIIPLIGGLYGLFGFLTGTLTTAGYLFWMITGFGLSLYVFCVSTSRKHKSKLYAELYNNPDFTIKVWMNKPRKGKWGEKLDRIGKNEIPLTQATRIRYENVQGTKTFLFTGDGHTFYIPARILTVAQVREYVVKAIMETQAPPVFANDETATIFAETIGVQTKNTTDSVKSVNGETKNINENTTTDTQTTVTETQKTLPKQTSPQLKDITITDIMYEGYSLEKLLTIFKPKMTMDQVSEAIREGFIDDMLPQTHEKENQTNDELDSLNNVLDVLNTKETKTVNVKF